MLFEVLPVNRPPASAVRSAGEVLRDAFNADVRMLSNAELPKEFLSPYRGQYDGSLVLYWLINYRGSINSIIVGIADADAYIKGLNFIFGIADPANRSAIVFLERLKYGIANDWRFSELFISRVKKEVVHEVGHVLGLSHCSNRRCVMAFSNSIFDTDYKEWRFCSRCFRKLINLGYYINEEYVIKS